MNNILFYTDTPISGGAEKHIYLLAKNLVKDGYCVKVVCSNYKKLDEWCIEMKRDGIEIIRLKVSHKHDPRHYFQLKKILRKNGPDLLHLHLWNPGSCRYAFWAGGKKRTEIITTEHDPFPLHGLKKRFKQNALNKTVHTITVSEANYRQMLEWYPELKNRMSVIHNGIDLDAFDKELMHFTTQEKQKIRSQLFGVKPEDTVILTIAALHPRKGIRYLLMAMQKIVEQKNSAKLVIIGEGPEKKELEKLAQKLKISANVRFLGHQESIPKILKSSEMFVLPSVKEAFGLVLLEAMAAQLPIVATGVGGIPEIIDDRKNGLLAEPKDSDALAERILTLLNNKPLRDKLAFLGHHKVKQFDVTAMVEKTKKVYAEILRQKNLKK
jgi:glycosyltransferase involved in cell wall biosynthesis